MQNQNQIIEDFTRLMSSIAGTMAGAGREAEVKVKERLRDAIGGDDWVTREEFDALHDMVVQLKAEVEKLKGNEVPGKTIHID